MTDLMPQAMPPSVSSLDRRGGAAASDSPSRQRKATMPVIEATAISKSYASPASGQTVRTLDNVSISAAENDFLVLLGPSGCGKSTFLNILAGLVTHDGDPGEVRVHDRVVTAPNPKLMAYMFQDSVLYPWRNVLKNVEFGLEAQPVDRTERRRRALRYLDMVGLSDFAGYYPRQISGGMAQRVALCRALALETDIVLMDEPFGALDEQSRIVLGDELVEIWRKVRRTIVFVTHSLTEAVYLGDRIAIFSARPGRIKIEIWNELPRPRTIGSPEFSRMVDLLWGHLKEESLAALRRERPASGDRAALPKE
jgi:NitT/TauT family transport system ATP-binding protein